jgi:hypothetical protein
LGWTEGRNVRIDYRWTAGDADRTRRYAAELVALAPDVILTSGAAGVGPLLETIQSPRIASCSALHIGTQRLKRAVIRGPGASPQGVPHPSLWFVAQPSLGAFCQLFVVLRHPKHFALRITIDHLVRSGASLLGTLTPMLGIVNGNFGMHGRKLRARFF